MLYPLSYVGLDRIRDSTFSPPPAASISSHVHAAFRIPSSQHHSERTKHSIPAPPTNYQHATQPSPASETSTQRVPL